MKLHSVEVKTLTPEIFRMFQVNTALLTAGDEKHLNTMTIGWGQLGTLWNLPVCTVYVRPERYTYEFMEAQDTFSVSVLPDSARDIAPSVRYPQRPGGGQGVRLQSDGVPRRRKHAVF